MATPLRLAMWSGPRNVSTALMRSFDSRPDTVVCDEPLYAHYLREKGFPHPLAHEVDRFIDEQLSVTIEDHDSRLQVARGSRSK